MGLMAFEDDNRKSIEAHRQRIAERVAAAGGAAAPESNAGNAARLFGECPGLTAEKEAALVAGGFDTVEKLAKAGHKEVAAIVGPKLSGAVRGWAAAKLRG